MIQSRQEKGQSERHKERNLTMGHRRVVCANLRRDACLFLLFSAGAKVCNISPFGFQPLHAQARVRAMRLAFNFASPILGLAWHTPCFTFACAICQTHRYHTTAVYLRTPPSKMDDGGGMDMMGSMSMTFASFSTYKMQVVWGWWDVKTKGQYVATLLALAAAVVVHRWLVKLEVAYVKKTLVQATEDGGAGRGGGGGGFVGGLGINTTTTANMELGESLLMGGGGTGAGRTRLHGAVVKSVPFSKRLMHAAFSGLLYLYALLLMLAAMTYNPGLFLALGVGYIVGELCFSTTFDLVGVGGMVMRGKGGACCE